MFNFKELEPYSNNLRIELNEWVSKIIEKQNKVFDDWCNENLFRHFGYMPKLFAVEVDDWHIKEYRPNDTTIVKELYCELPTP